MPKLKLLIIVFITILASSLVTWGILKNYYESSFENFVTLSSVAQDAGRVDFQSRLYRLNDESLRCVLAKLTRSFALGLKVKDVPDLKVIDGSGYPEYVEGLIDDALIQYNQTEIDIHANDCAHEEKLY